MRRQVSTGCPNLHLSSYLLSFHCVTLESTQSYDVVYHRKKCTHLSLSKQIVHSSSSLYVFLIFTIKITAVNFCTLLLSYFSLFFLLSDMLCAKNQKGLSAQAMHELGNIFFHIRNTKYVFRMFSFLFVFCYSSTLHH